LKGQLSDQTPPLPMIATLPDELKNPSEFWTAIGNKLRTSLTFTATVAMEVFTPVAAPLTTTSVLRDQLNPEGINCLRAFPGRGIRVWGARTISRDPNWRYVNVQRLFMTLRRWIDMNMGWAAFEPNEQHLWIRIQRELSAYLSRLLSAGALRGATAAEAFYVKCDAENNPEPSNCS
jgi:phage tail sheath protein FI